VDSNEIFFDHLQLAAEHCLEEVGQTFLPVFLGVVAQFFGHFLGYL
jgi:hypothetical protein